MSGGAQVPGPPEADDEGELVEVVVLDELFLLVRNVTTHGPDHEETRARAQELCTHLASAEPPYRLALFAGGAFRDGEYLPMGVECYRHIEALARLLAERSVQQLAVNGVPSARELVAMAESIAAPAQGAGRAPVGPHGIDLLPLPPERFGKLPEPDYGEPFATAQVERALAGAARLIDCGDAGWPFGEARGVAHSLDWAAEVSRPTAWRALELGVGGWDRARRAASAGLHVTSVLTWLGVDASIRRAAVHATLALAAHGHEARGGASVVRAAIRALASFEASGPDPRFGFDGHRLRTTAVLRGVAHVAEVNVESRVAPLCMLGYELERQRCPEDLDLELTKLDLFAWVAAELGRGVHPQWGRALIASHGPLPVGAHVLADGCLGVVVAPRAGKPWSPLALVGGRVMTPATALVPASPLSEPLDPTPA